MSNEYDYQTYSPSVYNDPVQDWDGFNFCNSGEAPLFGFGLYKLYEENNPEDYMDLDYRDDRFGLYPPFNVPSESAQDIWIKYDYSNGDFEWSESGLTPQWNIGEVYIWFAKNQGMPTTGKFEPYAPENLSISLNNGKPKLIWQHHSPSDDYWAGYKIYRCITVNNEPPSNFIEIATVGKTTTNYTDNDLCFANWKNIHYKVKTKNTERDSEFSNEVQINLNEEIINCDLTFNSDITVPSGKKLTITAGSQLSFQNNSKLNVYGTLNVNGTSSSKVTFDFITPSYSTYNGIKFYSGSSGTVDNTVIKNAYQGVYVFISSPTIKNSTIRNCSYGIKTYYNSPNI